jgi:hypothetical protein
MYIVVVCLNIHFLSSRLSCSGLAMTDVSTAMGIVLIGVGAASAVYGAILCYTTKVCSYM